MLKQVNYRLWFGFLLILGGVVFLLENMNVIALSDLFWAFVFGLVGVSFVLYYQSNRVNWWALLPGVIFLSIAASSVLQFFFPGLPEDITGAVFLGGIGLAFFLVTITQPGNWWAIIPGGVMLTLAAISLIEPTFESRGLETGGLLFLGIGFTFLLLFILPDKVQRQPWAIFPAAFMLLFGLLILGQAANLINYIWPATLIILGAWLLLRSLKGKA